ncbi:putative prephenate dehydratase [Nakaseomyces glabratus]|uniref:Putative prephenate dehydratase n=1 Tax=Candida glabrata TaxID=5478 RepID=A0A0W0D8E5_CANGB|nr:putative prephenate dehydratase [Nakaseomyces glabratus]
MTVKVLFLGPEGTYSHQAAIQQFSHLVDYNVVYEAVDSIPSCVDKLIEHDNDIEDVDMYSVVPLENSTNGQVVFTYDILRNLMQGSNGTNMRIRENQVVAPITIVGEQYCYIIQHSINDILGNTTRFLVFKKKSNHRRLLAPPSATPQRVSLLTFTIKQDDPGSLVEVLSVLKDFSLNMCSISSRPYLLRSEQISQQGENFRRRNWQYIFFIEFYIEQDKEFDKDKFCDRIDALCGDWCHWGRFPRDICYYKNTA